MKRIFFIIALILTCNITLAQGVNIKFNETVWDFGKIKEVDRKVTHVFTFTNVGKTPMVVENISVSCGCTAPHFSTKPVMPQGKGVITVSFDPKDRPGIFNHEIVITGNNRSFQTSIWVKGFVVERMKPIEEIFPFPLSLEIRSSIRHLNYAYIEQGDTRSMTLGIVNVSNKEISLGVEITPSSDLINISIPSKLGAAQRTDMVVTYNLSGKKNVWGLFANDIYLIINGKRAATPIPVSAIGVDRMSNLTQKEMEEAPRAKFDETYHDFGDIRNKSNRTTAFTLTNSGKSSLIIRKVIASQSLQVSLHENTIIEEGKDIEVSVTLLVNSLKKGRMNENIIIITNDPIRPMRQIRIAAELF